MWEWIAGNLGKVLTVPTMISGINFASQLAKAMQDGVITDQEFHNLMTASNGVETLILAVVSIVAGQRNKLSK